MLKNEQLIIKYLCQLRSEVRELKVTSKEVLTIKDAMIYTGYTKSYLYRLVSDGIIPYCKPNGKTVFFERKSLEKWLVSKKFSSLSENQEKARKYLKKY